MTPDEKTAVENAIVHFGQIAALADCLHGSGAPAASVENAIAAMGSFAEWAADALDSVNR